MLNISAFMHVEQTYYTSITCNIAGNASPEKLDYTLIMFHCFVHIMVSPVLKGVDHNVTILSGRLTTDVIGIGQYAQGQNIHTIF
jgi:hypothetical protein